MQYVLIGFAAASLAAVVVLALKLASALRDVNAAGDLFRDANREDPPSAAVAAQLFGNAGMDKFDREAGINFYANPEIGRRNLETLVAATLEATLLQPTKSATKAFLEAAPAFDIIMGTRNGDTRRGPLS